MADRPTKRAKTSCSGRNDSLQPVVKVHVNSIRAGYICGAIINASCNDGDAKIGSFSAHLVRRNKNFLGKCDDISNDLQEMARVMFEPDGSPRCRELLDNDGGAFLYIAEMEVRDGFKQADGNLNVRAAALWEFLNHPKLAGKWTVAAYIGDCHYEFDSTEQSRADINGNQPDAEFERKMKERRNIALDVRNFVRCGFRELSEETTGGDSIGWMYITKDVWRQRQQSRTMMSHAEAMGVKLRADAPLNRDGLVNAAELTRIIVRLGKHSTSIESIMTEVDRIVACGVDLTRYNSLHAAAANGLTQLFGSLVQRGCNINGKDKNKATPLMVAASIATGKKTILDRKAIFDGVRALKALGADEDVVDGVGRTALGHYYMAVRESNDFKSCFDLGSQMNPDPVMEIMLMPSGGPTAADKRSKGK